jgi:hypothetical protein
MPDSAVLIVAVVAAVLVFSHLTYTHPFPPPWSTPLQATVFVNAHGVHEMLRIVWNVVLLFMPLWVIVPLSALARRIPRRQPSGAGKLPPYPDPRKRQHPFVILGEVHRGTELGPSPNPTWLTIPEEGLFTGIQTYGATGTGKTASVMLSVAWQLFGYRAWDPDTRMGGLVLEVKGDFCWQVRRILKSLGREEDYVEIGPDSEWVYNPLHNDAQPTAIAYALVSFFKMLHGGGGKDARFWDESAEALVSFLIQIHRLRFGYVTLYDIYASANNPALIDEHMKAAEEMMDQRWIIISKIDYLNIKKQSVVNEVKRHDWEEGDYPKVHVKTRATAKLEDLLKRNGIPFDLQENTLPDHKVKLEQLRAARLHYEKMKKSDPTTMANVAAGFDNRLQIFSSDPTARRIFCPPKEAYDPIKNADGHLGRPLPPLNELIETPAVLAVRLPIPADPVLARIVGTLLKIDWQRATLNRIPQMQMHPERNYRDLALLIDEVHLLATFGGARASGDESYLNLSRGAKVIPVVACQHTNSLKDTIGEGWHTFSAAFQTTVVLRQKSTESAQEASKAAGRVDMIRDQYSVSESAKGSRTSVITGTTVSADQSLGLSRSYSIVRDNLIEPKEIMELPRGVALVMANNGRTQYPPTFCYLKPYGVDPNKGYFE